MTPLGAQTDTTNLTTWKNMASSIPTTSRMLPLDTLQAELELLQNDSHLQLMAGEMDAGEKRSVKAVLTYLSTFADYHATHPRDIIG